MSPSISYTQYFAVVLLLALYSAQQASAIRCYSCNSDYDTDCIYNPAQSKFAVQCSAFVKNTNSSAVTEFNTHGEIYRNALNDPQSHDIATKAVTDYNCATALGVSTKDGSFRVIRGCAVKPVTCDTYKYVYAVGDLKGNGFQVDKCLRCNTDFCNYSN